MTLMQKSTKSTTTHEAEKLICQTMLVVLMSYGNWAEPSDGHIVTVNLNKQKQPVADVLQKRRSYKSRKFHKNPCVGVMKACEFIKMRFRHRRFPVKFEKVLGIPFFTEHLP